ncbi:16 kDa phloem protein 1-like [Humulus lupulus]|uniref:16 kDa phloem protein 1-like n=1 Tax=Humulus lupulus TaxID=3486 RepID=UPI002B40F517|nr:16 kDa phloem protein 1-like [Humulus lupulus]
MATGIMEVLLVNGKGLGDTDFFGHMDPYVLIQYKDQERKSIVARGQGSSPSWNEKFSFRADYPGSGDNFKLIFKIMDKDTFSTDDYIGHATIYVKDLLAVGAENGTAQLQTSKYRVVGADQKYRGEIQVGVTFTRKGEQNKGEKLGGWKDSNF